MLFAGIGAGLWLILAGIVVEPPPMVMEAIKKSNERLLQLFRRPAAA
jgi:lipopolysaccharide export system permease protein